MSNLFQDLRYGIRTLKKSPRFTLIAVTCLALGIGVNTAMFSFVDGVLLKPLGYKDSESLVTISETGPNCDRCLPSPPTYIEWKNLNTVFSQVSAYTSYTTSLNLTGREEAEQIQGRFVSADYFDLLDIQPAIGRAFREGEDQIGKEQVVVLTNRFWRRRFGADPNVLGSALTLNERIYTVIGVLPARGVLDRTDNDVWLPLAIPPDRMRRTTQYFSALARLKPGVTLDQADGEMKRLAEQLQQEAEPYRKGYSVIVEPFRDQIVKKDLRGILLLLMGAVLFILLIASVNVANLSLARGAARQKEIAIRLAVGASRWRLMRQLLTESLLLAVAGGIAGILLAYWLIEAFKIFMPPSTIPSEAVVELDFRVLGFTLGVSLITGVLFGTIPAVQATRVNLTGYLKDHSLSSSARFSRNKSRSLLLISEIALTFMLLIGATLMIRSFSRLLNVDPGFKSEGTLSFKTTLAQTRFPQAHQVNAYRSELLNRIRALSGVMSASTTNALPLSGSGTGTDFLVMGRGQNEQNKGNARVRAIDPDYFNVMGIRLMKGRFLSESDTLGAPPVIMINQVLADRFWPDGDPIGQQVRFMGPEPFTIAGVIAEVKHNGLSSETSFEIYVSVNQVPETWLAITRSMNFVVRTSTDPENLLGSIQAVAASVDKDQPLFSIKTLDEVVSESVAEPRFRAYLFGVFAGLALVLAATGIYGVMAYSVTQRVYEIGIRQALGAQPRDIFKMVMGQGFGFALAGVTLGSMAAYYLSRVLESQLYEVSANDPLTFVMISVLLIAVAMFACYMPALRATRVDPMAALRYE